ncbi:hypothetical protein BDZ89DRAFT_1065959 [Hymenopellis radicata]|nr:hypothetical protein BDZ89DRAFT_1069742 [Hymenopellis radicata]KAF9028668.1 hypothetical protein BDZ89DRAFT_1065959 [Hymenopellis radicata]
MANHGYIPRDGKNISIPTMIAGLKSCYGLTTVLATFLTVVGYFILQRLTVDLFHIGKHNRIEHDASLVHADTRYPDEYAPPHIHPQWVQDLVRDIQPVVPEKHERDEGVLVDATDVARMRVRREKVCRPLDSVHSEIARGEMGIILGVWEKKWTSSEVSKAKGIPLPWLLDWLQQEKLPENWAPDHKQGLLDTVRRSKAIREAMERMQPEAKL